MSLLLRASVRGGEHAATRATRDGADGSVQGSAGPDHQPGARVGTARPRHRLAVPGDEPGAVYTDDPGQPPLPTRLMAGLAILKHTYDLSDDQLVARWVENPYFQYFCGEEFFQPSLPLERSSLTRWRQRMGEAKAQALLQESLAVAVKTKAMQLGELREVVVDTTVQEKAITFPTDAKLLNRARVRLVRLSRKRGLELRQSYARVGKLALIKHQRYAHAKQFKRANRQLRRLKTQFCNVSPDIERR